MKVCADLIKAWTDFMIDGSALSIHPTKAKLKNKTTLWRTSDIPPPPLNISPGLFKKFPSDKFIPPPRLDCSLFDSCCRLSSLSFNC